MKLILNWHDITQFVTAVDNPMPIGLFVVPQDCQFPVELQVNKDGEGMDLSDFDAELAVQGGTGEPTGTEGDAVYAAYLGKGGFTLSADKLTLSGSFDTRTAAMAALIGSAEEHGTKIAVKLSTKAGVAPQQTLQWITDCDVLAPVIESGVSMANSQMTATVVFDAGTAEKTVIFPNLDPNAFLRFARKQAAPAINSYNVTPNPDNPALNQLTVELAAPAPPGGLTLIAIVENL